MVLNARAIQRRYAVEAYLRMPITFVRRVIVGRKPYWRQYFWNRWGFFAPEVLRAAQSQPVLWLDALSGGEVTQMVSFCQQLRSALPGWVLLLSTNNRDSFRFATEHLAVDFVVDTPWDCVGPVRRALDAIRPKAVVSIQNVTSPVLVKEAERRGMSTVLVNGVLRDGFSHHPMFTRALALDVLRSLNWVGARSEADAERFRLQGVLSSRLHVTGNLKYDFAFLRSSLDHQQQIRDDLKLHVGAPVLLAASVLPDEAVVVARAFQLARRAQPRLRLILVPRHVGDTQPMIKALQSLGLGATKRTALPDQAHDPETAIVVDTFGELRRLYAIASVVFIGASILPRNAAGLGQNPIEPLVLGRPLVFGPHMNLWRDITEPLKEVWPGVEVASVEQFSAATIRLLEDSALVERLQARMDELIAPHQDDVLQNVAVVLASLTMAGSPAVSRTATVSSMEGVLAQGAHDAG